MPFLRHQTHSINKVVIHHSHSLTHHALPPAWFSIQLSGISGSSITPTNGKANYYRMVSVCLIIWPTNWIQFANTSNLEPEIRLLAANYLRKNKFLNKQRNTFFYGRIVDAEYVVPNELNQKTAPFSSFEYQTDVIVQKT